MSNRQDLPEAMAPPDEITSYYAAPSRRHGAARSLFNRFARHYDLINHIFSLGSGAWYRRTCLRQAGVGPGAVVVDMAVGTGLLARQAQLLMQGRGTLVGVDLSEAMLDRAQKILCIPLLQATAEAVPLADGIADFVTMGYALRHLSDIGQALNESLRLLRPGGKLVLLEISAPSHPVVKFVAAAFVGGVLPTVSALAARNRQAKALMDYHWRTIAAYAPPEAVLNSMRHAGFQNATCASELDFFRFYTGQKPLLDHR
ncbi:MAG: class I SAM-dependent methyltransferase [Rhodospirillales bacterium]|nr:class I SAM-dependent methyltransferase [Rhodospirillales bacterium]